MNLISATFLILFSFIQNSNQRGCGTDPIPNCLSPDVPELYFDSDDRLYSWPLETNNPPLSRITYHRQPAIYGDIGLYNLREYCFIDEELNSADCYSEWEYQTVAYCSTNRWLWQALYKRLNQPDLILWEIPEGYWQYNNRTQVMLWEWADRVSYQPVVGSPTQPSPKISRTVDRIQIARNGPTVFYSIRGVLMIKEKDTPLFSSSFSWHTGPLSELPYNGNTYGIAENDQQASACQSSYIFFTNWCEIAPFRPECRPQ